MINKMIVFQMDFVEDLKCEIELSAREVGVPGWNKNIYLWNEDGCLVGLNRSLEGRERLEECVFAWGVWVKGIRK